MSDLQRIRRQKVHREAEGYLELLSAIDRPLSAGVRNVLGQRVLATLDRLSGEPRASWFLMRGRALQLMERFPDAVAELERAASLDPSNLHIWLALGWCQKRNGQIDKAIEALEHALEADHREAIVYYNLACYWSLAENPRRAITNLKRAFELDPTYRDLVASECDFDPIRKHPTFQSLVSIVV